MRPAVSALVASALAAIMGLIAPTTIDAQGDARERTLFVSAVDENGEPVAGLGVDDFVVREDGVRREVLRASPATEPMDIVLLVDNSAAIEDKIVFFREALARFVAKMAPGNQIALITLADRPTIAVDYTSDPKRISDAVGRLFPLPQSGMTLLDAIAESTKGLARRETPRAVIVAVLTDGAEFTNRYSRDVVRSLLEANAPLHAVTIGPFYYSEQHSIRERSFLLDEGPRASGGQRVTMLSPNGLDQALQRLARELSSQYKVVYARPQSLVPPEKTEVSSARSNVTMRGRPGRG